MAIGDHNANISLRLERALDIVGDNEPQIECSGLDRRRRRRRTSAAASVRGADHERHLETAIDKGLEARHSGVGCAEEDDSFGVRRGYR